MILKTTSQDTHFCFLYIIGNSPPFWYSWQIFRYHALLTKSFQVHNSVNELLLFFFFKLSISGMWTPEILSGKTGRVKSQGQLAKGHRGDRDESVTRILEVDDKLVDEGGREGILERRIRREVGDLWRVCMVIPCLMEGTLWPMSYWSDSFWTNPCIGSRTADTT